MEAIFESGESNITGVSFNDIKIKNNTTYALLFYREIEKNVVAQGGDTKGSIILTPVLHQLEVPNVGWTLLSVGTAFIPNLFGMPIESYTAFCELELRVVDKNGNLIKKYSSDSTVTEYVAPYWGYYELEARKAALYESYKKTLKKLIWQMNRDKNLIVRELLK